MLGCVFLLKLLCFSEQSINVYMFLQAWNGKGNVLRREHCSFSAWFKIAGRVFEKRLEERKSLKEVV